MPRTRNAPEIVGCVLVLAAQIPWRDSGAIHKQSGSIGVSVATDRSLTSGRIDCVSLLQDAGV